ncbi:molybdenum cofactor guanylyltransferase [Micromonospora fluostatini]
MGGVDKPGVPVGGQPMRDRVLAAVADAAPRVLVGPPPPDTGPSPSDIGLPPPGTGPLAGVWVTREDPPGGGPVAAASAGLALLGADVPVVALLAADLPFLTPDAVAALLRGLADGTADGVCYRDAGGRRQSLCGVWRVPALRAALARLAGERGGSLAGASVRNLLAGLTVVDLPWAGTGPPPWFDCDTDDDVRRAEEWAR